MGVYWIKSWKTGDIIAQDMSGSLGQLVETLHRCHDRFDLTGADLRDADLSGRNLHGARLAEADLRGANLAGAVLSGACLTNARLDGACLDGTNLAGAYLEPTEEVRLLRAILARLERPVEVKERTVDVKLSSDWHDTDHRRD